MLKKPKLAAKIALVVLLAAQFVGLSFLFPKELDSAALTTAYDTLSDNRLSFVGAMASGVPSGSTTIDVKTSAPPGWATATGSANLFPGDTLMVGDNTGYLVDTIVDSDTVGLTGPLTGTDNVEDSEIIATRSATHTVKFTTTTAIANGSFKIRIKATGTNASSEDGIPDKNGFDFNQIDDDNADQSDDVTCTNATNYTFGWKTATRSGNTGCATGGYHCFECKYTGSGAGTPEITIAIGGSSDTHKLINPSPSSNIKTLGVADTYAIIIDNLNSGGTAIDTVTAKVAVVEAVRVTATVEPTINFTIAAGTVNTGSICGVSRTESSIDTTAQTVPLGTLAISSFVDAYQQLTVSTNGASGYTVTTEEDDQLSIGGDGVTLIPDSPGDTPNMSHTTKDEFNSTDTKGFAYSLQKVDAQVTPAFQYNDSGNGCTGTYCAKQFAEAPSPDTAQEIFNYNGPADNHDVYVCYRAIVSATQSSGDYENRITFIATAKF